MCTFGSRYVYQLYLLSFSSNCDLACQNNVEPMVTEFQDGFVWPMFDINAAVLARIGLDSLPPCLSTSSALV